VRASAISNARWLALSRVVSIGVQVAGVVWLSRLLTPADYGLLAMALVVTGFAELVRDLGTASALIQKEDLGDGTVLTTFWFTLALGAGLGTLVAGSAPLLALAFKSPDLTGIVMVLAVTFPILGATTVQHALLERQSRFALLARIEALSGISSLAAGVIAAYLGAGAYSLALQSIVYAMVSSVQLWFASDFRPRWFWSARELQGIRRFSDYLVGFNIVNYFSLNTDSMIIGRFLGADSLGPYSLAWRIVLVPLDNLTVVASRALYPIMSRQQSAPQEMTVLYLRTLSLIAFIAAPMMAGLFVLREPFVLVVLGKQWIAMTDILAWLVAVGFVMSLTCTTGTVLMARGRADVLFYLGIAGTVAHVAAFIVGLRWGVTGVAAGYCIATIVSGFWDFYFVFRVLDQRLSQFLRSVWTPMVLSGAMGMIVWGCNALLPVGAIPRSAQLVLMVLIGAGTYAALAFAFARETMRDTLRLIGRS
jgi:O-antigen/teichoic acid export membrane protein